MKKLRVMCVLGTRPEIIRLSRVLNVLDNECELILVHTGQNYDYELNEIFFLNLSVKKPDFFLNSADQSHSPMKTVGKLISEIDILIKKTSPDAFLVLGDTNSCLSVIPAKREKIPIFHMEAGNRCFDQRVPEETNRRIIDHIADVNMTYSSIARQYLINEGLPPDLIIKTGSPMAEILKYHNHDINSSKILEKLNLEEFNYFLVSAHREENIDPENSYKNFTELLNMLADEYKLPVVVSTHPRTKRKITEKKTKFSDKILTLDPMGFFDYNRLQVLAKVVLSDSGTITEESSILNFPALNIREAHERPEGMEEGSVIMTGFNIERVKQSISILDKQKRGNERQLKIVRDYEAENVSDKVVRIIHSYTDYVNRVVWKKF